MADEAPKRQTVDVNSPQFKSTEERVAETAKPKEETPRRKFEDLPPAAQRALMEAEERRRERDALKVSADRPKEFNGRGGLDPSRYDDYEIDGRAIDF
ncbi:DUF1674 domain-containing protein [Cohaesibacter haloalkalitolerans]|uniref:DUF1674 domain-containing protein n=1 Tax=Cohaesibacter haloalkalitolerans TaxID=1162980 RepID=UPI000E65E1CF|nr:DUF1674 domain-containing protein [Cohaesibacter haloalkalitolerans]